MTQDKTLPVPVLNLRKIWDLKKHEMQITQVQAAETLGWTQGAFSQYLNAITELNPSAVIKLANFLGVDPVEIDPDIDRVLPDVQRKEVRFNLSNGNKTLHDAVSISTHLDTFCIRVDVDHIEMLSKGAMLTVCDPNKNEDLTRTGSNEPLYAIQQKNHKGFTVVPESKLPDKSVIKRKFLILAVNLY